MARLIGFIANRPDLGARAVQHESNALAIGKLTAKRSSAGDKDGEPLPAGWGVGFFQGGEVLLRRRPIDDRHDLSFAEMTSDVRADICIAHVRTATVGATSTENTHPFRYRQWLFAGTGTVPAFDTLRGRLSESLPKFLQRDVRGETDSELLFHLFLSFLHDAGELHRTQVEAEPARAAARSSLALIDRMCAEEGAGPASLNMLIATPDYVLAVHAGAAMAYLPFSGKADVERLYSETELGRSHMPELASSRVTLIGADFQDKRVPSDWTALPERSLATFDRLTPPHIESI